MPWPLNEPKRAPCAYCAITRPLYWSGRRWICRGCMVDQQGIDPLEKKANTDV